MLGWFYILTVIAVIVLAWHCATKGKGRSQAEITDAYLHDYYNRHDD